MCWVLRGRELRGEGACGQGVGRGKGHALKSGRGSNKRALIGRWLEGDDDLMRSSPFSDSPPSPSHHLIISLSPQCAFGSDSIVVVVDCTLDIIRPILRPIINKTAASVAPTRKLPYVMCYLSYVVNFTLRFGWLALLSRAPFSLAIFASFSLKLARHLKERLQSSQHAFRVAIVFFTSVSSP